MKKFPPKLFKGLSDSDVDVASERECRFLLFLKMAETNGLQSPRHWALRQVLADKTEGQVKDKLNRRKVQS